MHIAAKEPTVDIKDRNMEEIKAKLEGIRADIGRIDKSVDKLTEALVSLARLEERNDAIKTLLNIYESKIDELERTVDKLSIESPSNKQTSIYVQNTLWSAAVIIVVYVLNKVGILA